MRDAMSAAESRTAMSPTVIGAALSAHKGTG
jgi:hypothetical protein